MKHKKCIRKLLSFLTIICCLAGSITPVYASGTESGSNVPRVTFTNEPVNSPDLYVTKIVENALEGTAYEAPAHAVFRFVLKQNGQIAKNVTYRVLDAEHGEIIRKTSMDMNYPFQTDQTGVFTLEAGQQAWFEGMGTGSRYEVIEQDTYLLPKTDADGQEMIVSNGYKLYYGEEQTLLHEQFDYETRSMSVDGWQKKSPSGGSTGEHSILANGSYETFVNRYIGKGTGDTTTLEITKTTSFPENYQAPDATPEFPFVVELDGAPYANEPFTAVCEKTKETRSLITDDKGRFILPGGWTARFENVPVDVDYKVYEDLEAVYEEETEETPDQPTIQADDRSMWPEGWWPAQDTVQTGATQSPLTALNFHNSNVSFVVTKRLEDNSKPEDVRFEFRLADENNDAISNAVYYLYYTNGEPVYKETDIMAAMDQEQAIEVDGKSIVTGKTGWQGEFYLAPGQAAVFVGLEPGTSYRVTETKDPSYTQVLPLPTDDTLHTVVADGQISTIDFVNRPESMDGVLTVTKNVTYGGDEGELREDEFHFILYRRLTAVTAKELFNVNDASEITLDHVKKKLQSGEIVLAGLPSASTEGDSGERPDPDMNAGTDILSLASDISPLSDEGDQNISSALSKVKSRISIGGGMNRPPSDLWYFEHEGEFYEVYVPAEGMIFGVPEGLEMPTYKTGPYGDWKRPGEFVLKAGQTARFEDKISVGDGYLVMEVDLSEEYWEEIYGGGQVRENNRLVYGWSEEKGLHWTEGNALAGVVMKGAATGQYTRPGGLALAFQNVYTPKKIDLVLTKTDGNDEVIADREAHFMLYRTQGQDSPVLPEPLPDGTNADTFVYETVDGILTIPDLKAGTYWLYELKAPSGYALLPEPVEIDLAWTADGLTVTIDGKIYKGPEDEEAVRSDVLGSIMITPPEEITDEEWSGGGLPGVEFTNIKVNLGIRNTELYELPNSGGIGIYWYSIGGTLLMLAAALILYKNQRRGRC